MNEIEKEVARKYITDRMWQLPERVMNHPVIHDYIYGKYNNCMVISGRQSYKSEIQKRKVVQLACRTGHQRILIGMPTYQQAKNIWWNPPLALKDLILSPLIRKISEVEMKITLFNESTIECFGTEAAHRREGSWCNYAVLDEAGSMDNLKEVYERTMAPMLAKCKGKIAFVGVPRGDANAYYRELWDKVATNDKGLYSDWKLFTWKSADVADAIDIERWRSILDPDVFRIEFEGLWSDNSSNLAYYCFNDANVKEMSFKDDLPLIVAWDFNYRIMAPVICQRQDDILYCHSQPVDRNTNLKKICEKVREELIKLHGGNQKAAMQRKIFMMGDYSGIKKEILGEMGSVWYEIDSEFAGWNIERQITPNPRVQTRLSETNSRLKSADGKKHLFVHPQCEELIKDFKYVVREQLRDSVEKRIQEDRTHSSDAIGYAIHLIWPIAQGFLKMDDTYDTTKMV